MKKTLFYSLFTLAALAVAAFTFSTTAYEPGAVATDFKLKNIDGKMVSLSDFKTAKGFIVTFTCNHCPYAKLYEDRLIAIDKKYKALGYPVIAIMPNDTINYPDDAPSEMAKRAKEKGFTFPYLVDETQEVAKTYGALKTPHIYVLQKNGKQLTVKYVGAIDDNYEDASKVTKKYLENAMDELIAGKDITVKSTKAIGCGIKWKK
jgi:peroxiredoxin